MKFTRFAVLASALLALTFAAQGQEKKAEKKAEKKMESKAPAKMEMPKPSAEAQKLSYFVGNWKSEGEMKENSFGMPAGKFSSTDKCEWFTGKYAVVCHSTGKSPMGPMHSLGILGYSNEEKNYTYYGIDNAGMASLAKGKADGNKWVYDAEEKMMGKTFKGRYTIETSSPDSYTFKYETSEDGQKWSTMMEGKSTKAAAAKPAEKKG